MRIQLEKYKGTKSRGTCPECNSRNCFSRYVDENGNRIANNVGRCNRESKCGYHYSPKQYYADNRTSTEFVKSRAKKRTNANYGFAQKQASPIVEIKTRNPHFDFIAPEHLTATLGNYDRNNFVKFLLNLFPDCGDQIQAVLKMYFVGTYEDYTCFTSIDRLNRVCRAKLIRFNQATGKRLKGKYDTSSLPAILKLKEDFNYKQIFFGEHLLTRDSLKPIAIVESEKTAIIASLCMPQFIWLATGSKQWLNATRLQRLLNRKVVLYSDADGFKQWQSVAFEAQKLGLPVSISALIENFATDEQKRNQYDLADYFIEQQSEVNALNDLYKTKVETVLNDEVLFSHFKSILAEQISIIEIDGNLPRKEAEAIARAPQNIQRIVSEFIN